ncbi:hypothetical protein CC80DRAFT_551231 [Byssothecium circinans]|uniref:Uncharacterized protein n=1 Tax=Byssothecium circinans TaxID=147558 RepID=A0A6A5TS74_9PLEO|nr:hypothetical protein CC80DRAFT_551231 [Byssothecium circinans]
MPPKHKLMDEEPTAIVYGDAIPWLQSSIKKAIDLSSANDEDFGLGPRDSSLSAFTDDEVVFEAAKVAYLLDHKLDAKGNLADTLRSIRAGPETPNHKAWAKKISTKQTQWKAAILHKFLVEHVKEVIRKWQVRNAWKTFSKLPDSEREKVWMAEYNEDPKGTIVAMMKPVIGVLDTANTFNTELGDAEDQTRMSAIRVMLRNKYLFGCEITYRNRVMVDRVNDCSREWAAYAQRDTFTNTSVHIADMPINSKSLPIMPTSQTKKQKLAGDNLEGKTDNDLESTVNHSSDATDSNFMELRWGKETDVTGSNHRRTEEEEAFTSL